MSTRECPNQEHVLVLRIVTTKVDNCLCSVSVYTCKATVSVGIVSYLVPGTQYNTIPGTYDAGVGSA